MLHYEMTVHLPSPITADQAADALDAMGERYDSATIRPTRIEFDGSARQVYGIARMMLDLRQALGWPQGLRFTVEHDPTDRLGNPIENS